MSKIVDLMLSYSAYILILFPPPSDRKRNEKSLNEWHMSKYISKQLELIDLLK